MIGGLQGSQPHGLLAAGDDLHGTSTLLPAHLQRIYDLTASSFVLDLCMLGSQGMLFRHGGVCDVPATPSVEVVVFRCVASSPVQALAQMIHELT